MVYNNKKNKIIFYSILVLALIASIIITNKIQEKRLMKTYHSDYKAIIIEKYRLKEMYLRCINVETKDTFSLYPSYELLTHTKILDTFHKLGNTNLCILKNDTIKCYGLDGLNKFNKK